MFDESIRSYAFDLSSRHDVSHYDVISVAVSTLTERLPSVFKYYDNIKLS